MINLFSVLEGDMLLTGTFETNDAALAHLRNHYDTLHIDVDGECLDVLAVKGKAFADQFAIQPVE